ncbi:PIG-L family deacetylase [Frankia sp. CNm7]|uniref:PIG-L family deacetylase n=1 Tax=Frankia nepalensis TaxID=1836974 RepID=A0A937R9T4_9ACTN|nr:PIG-L family deacetylase [Frankia nepalensis]MBL7516319.1 PIG-L family deacetylase [Frankia nepalensis]MBL7519685.1 PIG-L family deacetylase [Frankia nepalensis]MBL7625767.1 PIG-L family deacetylase [Frankia nepalensis]
MIARSGTPEAAWQAWPDLGAWPELDPPVAADVPAALVVAPHPDDEVLGVGGLMALLRRAGVPVTVLAVTDGDASHPGSRTVTPERLVGLRAEERRAALAELGLADVAVHRLGVPDGVAAAHERLVADEITRRLDDGMWCLATYAEDGHPDHEATGRAAAAAAARTGATLLEFPVWTWHWAVPGDARVPWHRARRVPLPAELAAAKRRAASRFVTQIMPLSPAPEDVAPVPPPVLARLLRASETIFWPDR